MNWTNSTVLQIKVGDVMVTQEKSAKLLGITVDDNQKWKTQIFGKGRVIFNLNQRLLMIRRLRRLLRQESLRKVAESLFNSKLRYGLQLCSQIRWSYKDKNTQSIKCPDEINLHQWKHPSLEQSSRGYQNLQKIWISQDWTKEICEILRLD